MSSNFKIESDKMEHSESLYFTEMRSREGILGIGGGGAGGGGNHLT